MMLGDSKNCLQEDAQITSKPLETPLNNIQDNVCTVMELSSVNYFQHLVSKILNACSSFRTRG
jgi:hypothetical protein